jgi:hypothetical protein
VAVWAGAQFYSLFFHPLQILQLFKGWFDWEKKEPQNRCWMNFMPFDGVTLNLASWPSSIQNGLLWWTNMLRY